MKASTVSQLAAATPPKTRETTPTTKTTPARTSGRSTFSVSSGMGAICGPCP